MSDNLPAPQHGDALPVESGPVKMGLLQGSSPRGMIEAAHEIAALLADIIKERQLYTMISGKAHVRIEAWTTCLAFLGITAQEEWCKVRETDSGDVYEVYVGLYDSTGRKIGGASAECGGPDEKMWAKRPANARRSMAGTRATGKAARLIASWILVMAGYNPTPAEEMGDAANETPTPIKKPYKETRTATKDSPDRKCSLCRTGFFKGQEMVVQFDADDNPIGMEHQSCAKGFGPPPMPKAEDADVSDPDTPMPDPMPFDGGEES